jgi:signal transduction histidine kinase/DNA-binding response OmpR family regulator
MWLSCKVVLLLLLAYSQGWSYHTADSTFHINLLPVEGLLLDKGWKYQAGDNPAWASPQWNDREWQPINPTKDIHDLPELWNTETGWFRLRFIADSAVRKQSLALLIQQTGASQIYLNGKLILTLGRISIHPQEVYAETLPANQLIPLQLGIEPIQTVAVRFALQKNIPYIKFAGRPNPALQLQLKEVSAAVQHLNANNITGFEYFRVGIFFILAILHLAFFLFYPAQRTNLYFFFFAFIGALTGAVSNLTYKIYSVETKMYILVFIVFFSITLASQFYLIALYKLFNLRKGILFYILSAGLLLILPLMLVFYRQGGTFQFFLILFTGWVFMQIAFIAIKRRQRGAWIVAGGALSFFLFFSLYLAIVYVWLPAGPDRIFRHWAFNLSFVSLPISIALVMAIDFAFTNRSLGAKLIEVQELSEKNIRQEQEKRQLQETDEIKSRFFANISHEFRTPLSLIKGTVEKLRKKDAAADRQADYGAIDRSAGRLLQMINQLLDLSRLESGKLSLHLQPANLSEQLKVLAGSFASLFESKGITYRYTVPLQPVWVQLDHEKLEAIINNLLSNAAKFTPAKGQVCFTATLQLTDSSTCSLLLLVEDTGIGIPQAQLPRIFERFYQIDSSATRHYEGTGIGLALVKELVSLHGGKIETQSTEGKGSTFTLHIPYTLSDVLQEAKENGIEVHREREELTQETNLAEEMNEEEEIPKGEFTGKSTKHAPQILVVEDNADLRGFIAGYLSESFGVKQAPDGLEGYQIAVETMPDLIISDVMMPVLDGISLCRKLKADERTSHIPVILLTAKADAGSKLNGLETGADDYLTKPFSAEELLQRIDNLIRQRQKLKEKYSRSLSLQPAKVSVASADERFLQKVLAIMEENMSNADFDVDSFSREVGMSRAQLNRKITALLDQSPNEFIRTMRLKRASQLLGQKQSNIGEIAFLVGFSNPGYFTKCFRDYYGVAPSEYTPSSMAGKN